MTFTPLVEGDVEGRDAGMNKRLVDDDIAHDPVRAAEDDGLRSAHVRDLLQRPAPTKPRPRPPQIPRVIIQFWDDPFGLPSDVRECLDSWQPLAKSGFTRVLFDDDRASRFISRVFGPTFVAAFDRCHHPAMRCDYFRLCYLLARGGFYVDADEFYLAGSCDELFLDDMLKVQPICYDPSSPGVQPHAPTTPSKSPLDTKRLRSGTVNEKAISLDIC